MQRGIAGSRFLKVLNGSVGALGMPVFRPTPVESDDPYWKNRRQNSSRDVFAADEATVCRYASLHFSVEDIKSPAVNISDFPWKK
tara:strand:- start:51518 stop:51772 length:255 start_codon:yes stop_codon:yes gene_type:complete